MAFTLKVALASPLNALALFGWTNINGEACRQAAPKVNRQAAAIMGSRENGRWVFIMGTVAMGGCGNSVSPLRLVRYHQPQETSTANYVRRTGVLACEGRRASSPVISFSNRRDARFPSQPGRPSSPVDTPPADFQTAFKRLEDQSRELEAA